MKQKLLGRKFYKNEHSFELKQRLIDTIEIKNNLGNYTYQIKNTLKNEGFQDKIFGKKEGQ
jgi:hypothetical protein